MIWTIACIRERQPSCKTSQDFRKRLTYLRKVSNWYSQILGCSAWGLLRQLYCKSPVLCAHLPHVLCLQSPSTFSQPNSELWSEEISVEVISFPYSWNLVILQNLLMIPLFVTPFLANIFPLKTNGFARPICCLIHAFSTRS